MSLVIGFGYIRASPDSVLGELSRGMLVFCRVVSIAVQVADDGVDLNDDVLGNLGLYGLGIRSKSTVYRLLRINGIEPSRR